MRKIKLGGLFRTIFITSLLCMLLPVLVVSIISLWSFSTTLSGTSKADLQQLSVEKANEVNDFINYRFHYRRGHKGSYH